MLRHAGSYAGVMKRIRAILLSAFCLLWAGVLYAQGKVPVQVEGRASGSVSSIELNGLTYVNVQTTARKLGASVELFATSKQAKITTKGFFAILTASLNEIIVNGKNVSIPGEVVVRGGQLMAPVEVFLLEPFQLAVNRYISFEDGTLQVERRYTAELTPPVSNKDETLLVLDTQKDLHFTTQQTNAHTVIVTLQNAVLKRDTYKRLHTDYIASVDARQVRGNVQLKVILGSKARDWSFTPQPDNLLVFRAAATKGSPKLPAKSAPVVIAKETPSVLTEDQTDTPLEKDVSAQEVKTEETHSPVVDEDDFEEMKLQAEPHPLTISAAGEKTISAPAKPAPAAIPVMKAEPNPLSISARKKMRIVVDPGHGGKDAGAVRGKYREKDWNLAVGKELARLLKKGNFEVKITRDTDTFIALSDRSKLANNFKADLFVSVHVNATKKSQANGFQVYFRSENPTDKEAAATAALENEAMQYEEVHYNFVDALLQSLAKNEYINESSKLAGYIKNAVYKQPGIGIAVSQNNSIRQANFYVLKGVQSPAVLVEMGFISSPKDRAKLAQSAVQKKMAQGIYNGIVNYAKQEGWLQ